MWSAHKTRIGADLIPINSQALWNLAKSAGVKPSKLIKHRHAETITRRSLATFIEAIKCDSSYSSILPETAKDVRKLEKLAASPLGWEMIRGITHEKADMPIYNIRLTQYAELHGLQ